jgi:hypothetical protein
MSAYRDARADAADDTWCCGTTDDKKACGVVPGLILCGNPVAPMIVAAVGSVLFITIVLASVLTAPETITCKPSQES